MHFLFRFICKLLKIKRFCIKYPTIARIQLAVLFILIVFIGLIFDSQPYTASSLCLVPFLIFLYWTFYSVSSKTRTQNILLRFLAAIEAFVLAKEIETIHLSKEIKDSKKKAELLKAYYLAKHAYEKVFPYERFPKLMDITDKPPSIQDHLKAVELEVLKKQKYKFKA